MSSAITLVSWVRELEQLHRLRQPLDAVDGCAAHDERYAGTDEL
jgi:hypothetical protein